MLPCLQRPCLTSHAVWLCSPPSSPAGYVLDADSPAALRPHWDRRAQRRIAATAGAKNLRAVQAGWGDAAADVGPLNPYFKEEELAGYRWVMRLLHCCQVSAIRCSRGSR